MADNDDFNSDDEQPKMKIVFAKGCFDDFDGTQEELDELVAQLTEMAESGELLEKSVAVDDIEILGYDSPEELIEEIAEKAIEASEKYGFDEEGFVKYPFTGNTRH